jgi:murein L,D-transpeptidase YcbB/YkuD
LNEPLSQRAIQIELAMERLRWIPEITEGRAVIVNIPAFQLSAYDDITQDTPTTTMRVVVGKAAKNKTPVLTADMRFVDFQPYWNVPFKIARDEILPKVMENPSYLSGQNMELISRSGKRIGAEGSGGFAEQIRQGAMGIRQKPGKGNALGKVKFIFPNKSDVYLHDTPSVSFFSRARRDLSHGCVRVAHPEELAKFVLRNQEGWDNDSIDKALNSTKNQRVVLKNTIPVLFLYNTSFFDENNNLTFYPDIYQHDAALLEALKTQTDLSDKVLFAPKEVIPPTDAPTTEPPVVNTTNANQPAPESVVAAGAKNVQSVAIPKVDTTVSP